MDSLSGQKTKSRKIKKFVKKKSRVQIIIDLFSRTIEIIVVLVTIAKLCHHLIIAFEDSGVAAVILANRNLAFVIGNAIVIALIAKSGLFLNQELDVKCKSNDVYEEFVRERSKSVCETATQSKTENIEKQSISDQTEKQNISDQTEKQSISDQTEKQNISDQISKKRDRHNKREKLTKQSIVEHQENLIEKKQSESYQRSQSENLGKISYERLRRSETDASFERFESDDELRYKIESFIARQRRNQIDD